MRIGANKVDIQLSLVRRLFLVIFRKKKLFIILQLVLFTLLQVFTLKQNGPSHDFEQPMDETKYYSTSNNIVQSDAKGINEEDKVVVGSVSKSPLPKVVWLMSYPNSGTSFTMHLVSKGGNRSVATNYGMEDKVNATNIPLYPTSPNGPYIIHSHRSLPTEYILTKTHCGGRCVDCSPQGYIENQTSFLKRCAQGFRKNESFEDKEEITWYNPHLAQKAIHIVRNPFDNLVSNFHLEWKKKMERMKSDTNSVIMYSNATKAFRDWCSDADLKYIHKEKKMLPMNVVEFFEVENIPCHAHFYRYAKWHEYTIGVIKELNLTSLNIFYEDYDTQFNTTAKKIFDFLKISQTAEVPIFVGGKTYLDFFTKKEREVALSFVKRIVGNETRNLLSRYFE